MHNELDELGECWMHWIRDRDEYMWWEWYFKEKHNNWMDAFTKIAHDNIFGRS